MNTLEEIINDEKISLQYFDSFNEVENIMNNRKKLHEIENPLDLDMCLEKMHTAKTKLDFCIRVIEYLKIKLTESLNIDKENYKFSKIENEVLFSDVNKQMKEDLSAKEFEKKKEFYLVKKFKNELAEIESDNINLTIINFELKSLERLRENIDDVYLSLKKKYDAYIKFRM